MGFHQIIMAETTLVQNQSATDLTHNFDCLALFITQTYRIPRMICLHVGHADGRCCIVFNHKVVGHHEV